METLTYLHHACVYETVVTEVSDRATISTRSPYESMESMVRVRSPQFRSLKFLRLVLSFVVFGLTNFGLVNLGPAQQAQAVIQPGDRGAAVIDLQSRLARLRYFPPTATGFYGTETTDAVTQFQQDHLLLVDGIAGRETLAVLREREDGITTAVVPFSPTVNVVATTPSPRPINGTTQASGTTPIITNPVITNPVITNPIVTNPAPRPVTSQPTTPSPPTSRTYETPISAFFNILDCGQASCF